MKQLEQLPGYTHVSRKTKTKTNKHQTCFTSNTSKRLKPRKKQLIITKRHVTRFAAGSVLIGEKCTERVSLCEHVS